MVSASRWLIPLNVCAETRVAQPSRKLLETCATAQWGQCGGLSCPAGSGCADQAWACCPSGFGCSRGSAYYWQCLPNAPSAQVPSPSPAATPAATPSPTQSPAPVTTTAPKSPPPPPVPVTTTAPVATNPPSTRKLAVS